MRLGGCGRQRNRRLGGAERRDEFVGFGLADGEIIVLVRVESLEVGLGGGGSEVVEEERADGEEGEEVEEGVASWDEERERGSEERGGRSLRHCWGERERERSDLICASLWGSLDYEDH